MVPQSISGPARVGHIFLKKFSFSKFVLTMKPSCATSVSSKENSAILSFHFRNESTYSGAIVSALFEQSAIHDALSRTLPITALPEKSAVIGNYGNYPVITTLSGITAYRSSSYGPVIW
jgi:hypothetical protein